MPTVSILVETTIAALDNPRSDAACLHCLWDGTKRLLTVADMFRFHAINLFGAGIQLELWVERFRPLRGAERDRELSNEDKTSLATVALGLIRQEAKIIGLTEVEQQARRIQMDIAQGRRCTPEIISRELEGLHAGIVMALSKYAFAYIKPEYKEYFDQEKLFGQEVYDAFPSMREDIKDAGDCLSCGLYTASIFHLMRVAEKGLRILARDRRVKIKKTKIDYAEWQTIIEGIQGKIDLIAKGRRGPKKSDALEFYRGALGEFYAFKDAWRNHVMHSRERYDEHKAKSAMQHVSEFMKRLASRLGENRLKPLAWKL